MSEQAPVTIILRKVWRRFVHLLAEAAGDPGFRRWYRVFALFILFGTTIVWSVIGARLHIQNADQLSDPYLFTNHATFRDALFSGAHTFLLKWPIFWLVSLVGVSTISLTIATTAMTVLTVGALALVLYAIDRRPLVFGTVCLGLSLALLLIPVQPYAGALLPVSMAMLTTRNLEYALYLIALVYFARTEKIVTLKSLIGIIILALLIASDKLFLSLSAGGALAAALVYVLFANWALAKFAVRWLIASLIAAATAMAGLFAVAALHITHVVNGAAATPYGSIHSIKQVLLGVVYALLGTLTNLGANPAYDNRVLSKLPVEFMHRMWSMSLLVYLIALLLACYGLWQVWRVLRPTLRGRPANQLPPAAHVLAIALIWSTVVAVGVFVVTDHYFPVDARYLTIGLFATAVATSVSLRQRLWHWPEDLLLIACVLLVAIAGAVFVNIDRGHTQQAALANIEQRNAVVSAMLKQHKVDVLIGDYWRVMPIKFASGGTQNTLPLGNCTDPYQVLTSKQWQPDLTKHSFAYLVTLDGSITNFPDCSLQEITQKYGRPSSTQIVSGTKTKPTEALLFYENNPARSSVKVLRARQPITTPAAIPIEQMANTSCEQSTSLNIVAHQDDDLLFLNPDIQQDIDAGKCVRTLFITAGDAGYGATYWLNRQLGSQAAYNTMLGKTDTWDEQTVAITESQRVTVATPHSNPRISLIFFNLPDGDLRGKGFEQTGHQSLERLHNDEGSVIHSVDGRSVYNTEELRTALTMFMNTYQPDEIRTQGERVAQHYADHSDHIYVGRFVDEALNTYYRPVQLRHYFGYPIRELPANIEGSALAKKEAAFLAYAAYDGGVCRTLKECSETPTYGSYITRQYTAE